MARGDAEGHRPNLDVGGLSRQAGLADPDGLSSKVPKTFAQALGVREPSPDDTWNDVFHRAFLDRASNPRLPKDRVVVLHGYPASMAALAQDQRSERPSGRGTV